MKTRNKEKAKGFAKAQSLHKGHKDMPVYIIRCNRTEFFYVDTNSFIRMWEQIIGCYVNGVFKEEE